MTQKGFVRSLRSDYGHGFHHKLCRLGPDHRPPEASVRGIEDSAVTSFDRGRPDSHWLTTAANGHGNRADSANDEGRRADHHDDITQGIDGTALYQMP